MKYQRLTFEERENIHVLVNQGKSNREIFYMAASSEGGGYYPPLQLIPVSDPERPVSSVSTQDQKRALEKTDNQQESLSSSIESGDSKRAEGRSPKRMKQTTLLEATQRQWTPPEDLIEKSVADHWAEAIQEWGLERLEMISSYHRPKTCICGLETRKVCRISNRKNGKVTLLGQCCFSRIKEASSALSQIPSMFDSVCVLKKNRQKAATAELIEFAAKKEILSAKEQEFYLNTRGQDYSNLTKRQKRYRVGVNDQIITTILR